MPVSYRLLHHHIVLLKIHFRLRNTHKSRKNSLEKGLTVPYCCSRGEGGQRLIHPVPGWDATQWKTICSPLQGWEAPPNEPNLINTDGERKSERQRQREDPHFGRWVIKQRAGRWTRFYLFVFHCLLCFSPSLALNHVDTLYVSLSLSESCLLFLFLTGRQEAFREHKAKLNK